MVSDIKIAGTGCSISQSSASLMSAAVKGKPVRRGPRPDPHLQGDDVHPRVDASLGQRGIGRRRNGSGSDVEAPEPEPEIIDIDALGELAALQGVVKFPVRIKCATLSWNTLAQGLDESESTA